MSPKLSVVVPFHAVESYIEPCLESIRTQLYPNIEVIMVDDGSPDGSSAIAERYTRQDDRFKLIRLPHPHGPGPARNVGIAEATGEYLAFVDSDDLLPPRAYTRMVGSLEQTGSDIAAGNAWRFSNSTGTRPSWTHRQAFEEDRTATHINEFPLLVRDRMLWNKVYRRSFWDAHGYEFPAIRYEDYPVALRAHLEASSVDVISKHVYLWRDRESGDSITQRTFDVDNARDRVTSAHMILDSLAEATPAVAEAVHAYFIDVDIVALAGALATAPAAYQPELEMLAIGLARRLEPQQQGPTRLARLAHLAFRDGDVNLPVALARWRSDGDRAALLKAVGRDPKLYKVPSVVRAITPRRRVQNPLRPRRLRAQLIGGRVENAEMFLDVEFKLRRQFAQGATVHAVIEKGRGEIPIDSMEPVPGGVRLTLRIGADTVEGLGRKDRRVRLHVRNGVLRWAGGIELVDAVTPPVARLANGRWLSARRADANSVALHLGYVVNPVPAAARIVDGDFVLDFAHHRTGTLAVVRPEPTPWLSLPIADGVARIPSADVLEGDPSDNPFSGRAYREVTVLRGHSWARVYLTNAVDEIRVGEATLELQPATAGYLQLVHDRHLDDVLLDAEATESATNRRGEELANEEARATDA